MIHPLMLMRLWWWLVWRVRAGVWRLQRVWFRWWPCPHPPARVVRTGAAWLCLRCGQACDRRPEP